MGSKSVDVKMILSWILQLLAAGIFLQTLYFKFTAAPESVYIFEKVGMEPWGRIGTGIIELVAGILLLWPRRVWLGALIGLLTITGAIFFHLTSLGIEVRGDGGTLFYMAVVTFISCLIIIALRREQVASDLKVFSFKQND